MLYLAYIRTGADSELAKANWTGKMASDPTPRILLTGATGYIGGTILTNLLSSSSPALSSATITCLVRGSDRAEKLTNTYGERVHSIVYKDLDDVEATIAAAAEHDIVINTTLGFHLPSAQALVRGLAKRKASTGRDVWMIHTSGTSNLADQPYSGKWVDKDPERTFDDAKDDIYTYECEREALHPYAQRTTELGVIDLGLELGVKTLVIMSPTIYGIGSGLFNKTSIQIPAYVQSVLDHGHAVVVGDGKGIWDHVHVEDLAELYKLAVLKILQGDSGDLPVGKKGIIFSGNGRHTWMEVAQAVANACCDKGKITDRNVQSVELAEGAKIITILGHADETMLELGLSSNSRTESSVGRTLGWKPERADKAWQQGFHEDLDAVLKKR